MSNLQLLQKAQECLEKAKEIVKNKKIDNFLRWEKQEELIEQAEMYYLAIG